MASRLRQRRNAIVQRKRGAGRPRAKTTGKCSRTGKVTFRSRVDAVTALAGTGRGRRAEKRLYRCEFCGRWHLTSQSRRGTVFPRLPAHLIEMLPGAFEREALGRDVWIKTVDGRWLEGRLWGVTRTNLLIDGIEDPVPLEQITDAGVVKVSPSEE